MKTKYIILPVVLLAIIMISPMMALAIGGPDSLPGSPDSAPIDGGLSLLVAAGVGYGAKKVRAKRNKQKEIERK